MRQTSMTILGLLMGTDAIHLYQHAVEDLSMTNDEDTKMSNPNYMSDMTLADWKLFNKSESLAEFRHSQQDCKNYESRVQKYQLAAVKSQAHIAKQEKKLLAIRNESKKIVFEREMNTKHA